MCGIVAMLAFGSYNKKQEMVRQSVMRYFSAELMIETEDRGKDATGASILFNDGFFTGIKRGEESSVWMSRIGKSEQSYGSFTEVWKQYEQGGKDGKTYTPVKVFLGHCRKGTTGDKEDNNNNHPIKIKNIVGIHNGVIRNDDVIAKQLGCKRDGKVDSEMIFRLFDYYTNGGKEPFTLKMLTNIIDRLTGAFAVMAFNADNLHQVPVFRDGRPLEMIFIKELGLLMFVSEEKFWNKAHFRYERAVNYGDLKLPSLVNLKPEKIMFTDCHAAIFDLDVQCTTETKFEDLCEHDRVSRFNKRWTTKALLSSTSSGSDYGYAGGQRMALEDEQKEDDAKKQAEEAKKKEEESKKDSSSDTMPTTDTTSGKQMRVFDSLTKKFKITHVSPKVILKKDESKVLPVSDAASTSTSKAMDKKEDVLDTDDAHQDNLTEKLIVEDHTTYTATDAEKEKDTTKTNVAEVSYASGSRSVNGSEDDVINEITIDMTPEEPELIEYSERAYSSLPENNRGYKDIDALLEDTEVKNATVYSNLGHVIAANRVAAVQWKRGFIAGFKFCKNFILSNAEADKVITREKHISMLKSMVIILAQIFSKNKTVLCEKDLRDITKEHAADRPSFDMNRLDGVFNDYEIKKVEEVATIIAEVGSTKD